MATLGERRSLPSPEAMLGQPWSHWVDAAKLHGNDGAALEESFKEYGKNREAMRLCREDQAWLLHVGSQDTVVCNPDLQDKGKPLFVNYSVMESHSLSKPGSN
uniref:Uncharacterized protein n=1 Tax=Sphaerodactylus townsendi TaxID=933632 RepID=A0ACB8EGJ3_9SAUR